MPTFVDTHTHLYDETFSEDFKDAVRRALDAGVGRMIFPDIDSSDRQRMLDCADMFPDNISCTAGLHPTSVNAGWKEELDAVHTALGSGRKWVGIGEIGIDCYWSKEFLKEQKEVFDAQLSWAAERSMPVIIHSREATAEIFDVLEAYRGRGLRGVFHAYSGSVETFNTLGKYGDFYIGIGGVLTYKNSKLHQVVDAADCSRILLETDSPYLTPVPKRGTRNESSYIPYIAERIALIKKMDISEVGRITTENALDLFGMER